jgi:hypothetical protein
LTVFLGARREAHSFLDARREAHSFRGRRASRGAFASQAWTLGPRALAIACAGAAAAAAATLYGISLCCGARDVQMLQEIASGDERGSYEELA